MNKTIKLVLPKSPTLQDYQGYVKLMEEIRGFSDQPLLYNCLLLGEEVGELFKAIRKEQKDMSYDNKKSKSHMISEELADVMMFVFAIANKCNIDLEEAFREKEEENKKRSWTKKEN